jgi:hypothetical protein
VIHRIGSLQYSAVGTRYDVMVGKPHVRWLACTVLACGGPKSTPATPANRVPPALAPPFARLVTSFDGGSGDPCTDRDVRALENRSFAEPRSRAHAWLELAQHCEFRWYSFEPQKLLRTGLDAYVQLATALLDAGYPHDCELVLAQVLTPYQGVLSYPQEPDTEPLVEVLEALGERCGAANERRIGQFAPANCPGPDPCFEITACGNRSESTTDAEIEETDSRGQRTLIATEGPLTDPDFCCELDTITTSLRERVRYVRFTSNGIARVCGGGTAARILDGIYRIDGDRLVLEADSSIPLH